MVKMFTEYNKVRRPFMSADVPCVLQLPGLSRSDNKRRFDSSVVEKWKVLGMQRRRKAWATWATAYGLAVQGASRLKKFYALLQSENKIKLIL